MSTASNAPEMAGIITLETLLRRSCLSEIVVKALAFSESIVVIELTVAVNNIARKALHASHTVAPDIGEIKKCSSHSETLNVREIL